MFQTEGLKPRYDRRSDVLPFDEFMLYTCNDETSAIVPILSMEMLDTEKFAEIR